MSGTSPVSSDDHKLDSLLKLAQLLATSLKLSDVLNNALRGLEECLQAQSSSIYEVDYQRGELFFRCARGVRADDLMNKRIKIGEGVSGWVAQTGRPKIVDNADHEEQFFGGFDRELGFKTHSLLTVPLISKGTVIGVIQILNKTDNQRFSRDDLELAQIMAGQIAISMENARLYQRLEDKQKLTEEELARTQERLIQSERQAALSGLAHSIAHQVRNPTMSIGGFARRILTKTPANQEDIRRYAEVIVHESERLEELVRQVVYITKLNPSRVPTDMNRVVGETIRNWQPATGELEIITDLTANLPSLNVDPALMKKALEEVLKNAREAEAEHVTVRTRVQGESVMVEIIDDGQGFQHEDRESALDPFFSTRAQNIGLGLTIVARIMEEHHGNLIIKSQPGHGAVVTLSLPIQSAPAE